MKDLEVSKQLIVVFAVKTKHIAWHRWHRGVLENPKHRRIVRHKKLEYQKFVCYLY